MTEAQLHSNLDIIDASWNWTLGGNGQLTGKITVPAEAVPRAKLRLATNPWQSAIYVKKTSDNSYPWGGPVVKRRWNRRNNQITITCIEWRAWPYMLILEPWNVGNLDRWFEYMNQDQLETARELFQYTLAFGPDSGCPPIDFDNAQTSGKLRDLTFWGSTMQRAGNLIDSMANRDGGFEWTLAAKPHPTTGHPRLHFYNFYPQRGGIVPGLHFKSTADGSNCDPGDVEEDASQQFNRVWTTGAGQPPDMAFGWDMYNTSGTLRLDTSAAFPTVLERPTLMSHARRIRRFYAEGIQTLPISHNWAQIDPDRYGVGDRARLTIKDRWTDIDLTEVRVISKEVNNGGAGSVKLVMDLTDDVLPEVDPGGAI